MRRPGFLLWRRLAQRRHAQRKARTPSEPRPSFWQRLDAGFARARAWALSTVVLVAVGLLGWAIGEELARNPVIIEPLLVPESAVKAGWTGEALARQMRDRIREINEGRRRFASATPTCSNASRWTSSCPAGWCRSERWSRWFAAYSAVRRGESPPKSSSSTGANALPSAIQCLVRLRGMCSSAV